MTFPTVLRKRLDFRLVCSQADNNYENIPAQCQPKAKIQEGNLFFPFFLFSVNNTHRLRFYFNKQKVPLPGSL